MPRKSDIKEIDGIARRFGIDRHEFGDFVEHRKRTGEPGTKNERGDFTWSELEQLAREFRDGENR